MPKASFSDNLDFLGQSSSDFFILKSKKDSIVFRLADGPNYRGMHWPTNADKPIVCKRINEDMECEYCSRNEKGELPDDVELDEEGKIKKGRNWYKPNIQFVYPVLVKKFNDKEVGEAGLFQTSTMIHTAIKQYADEGVDVFGCDWKVIRQEEPVNQYYVIMKLGSDDLSDKEQVELEKAKSLDLEKIMGDKGKESSMKNKEDVDVSDIPF